MMKATDNSRPQLKIRRVNLDTGRENVVVISRRSTALRPEVFSGFSRVELRCNSKVLLATLLLTDNGLVNPDEIGLADPAFRRFAEAAGSLVTITPAPPPDSLDAVRAKIQGRALNASEISAIIDDITHYRYSDMEIAAFLVGSASFMTSDEMLALAHAMAQAGTQLTWDTPVVVDKHCIGGIPGNRTSMIVVPIAAAHGLTIPKTSSRAITSPAGTADTMEVLARVDLTVDEMKEVVKTCHGCLVWGGHVNLSPADDILISVERPLSLDTREQMVASIMSKKIAAGATHLLIDLPIGPAAKLRTALDAMRLRKLFEFVGDHFGIAVEVITTDGRQPIGSGIGPVLEAQDVMAVLANDPAAPADLREKSLRLAAHLLEYDPDLRGGTGYRRARELLDSGAALKQMHKMIEAQGPAGCRTDLGTLTADITATSDGTVEAIDCLRFNRLARTAGAPIDKGAGIKIFKKIGDRVEKGEPLYRRAALVRRRDEVVNGAVLQSLPTSAAEAARLAERLGVAMHAIALHRFPDGELRVTVGAAASTVIVYASLDQPNDKLLALSFAAEALRRGGAKRLVLVAPYLCYMRQDAAFHEGEAVSQKVIGRVLAGSFDRVITVDAHLHRTKNIRDVFPGIDAENLSAMPAIADALRAGGFDPTTIVVGPDEESRAWIGDLAARLKLAHAVARKTRRGDRSVAIAFADPKMLAGRPVLLVDDIVSSGGTLMTCAKALAAAGAKSVDAIVTHALFAPELVGKLFEAGIRSVKSTNSVPHSTNAIALDAILADALQRETAGAAL